jgi:hypothetical protein
LIECAGRYRIQSKSICERFFGKFRQTLTRKRLTIRLEFERVMLHYRIARTIINDEDGNRTVYETYRMPIFDRDDRIEYEMGNIMHDAGVLGYRSTIGPIVIPGAQKKLGGSNPARPSIYFFLEKREPPLINS